MPDPQRDKKQPVRIMFVDGNGIYAELTEDELQFVTEQRGRSFWITTPDGNRTVLIMLANVTYITMDRSDA